jgi:BirA family biotin operon repressor/biotin-[acetyl-CoA-carboxylase] ligase
MNEIIGSTIGRIHITDSTNNYAANQLLTKRPVEGAVFVADSQNDGRGQISNKWESEPNKNLTFSIVLYPCFIEIIRQFEISKAIALGVADYLGELTEQVSIKWPNDIYIGNGKIAGILIENSISSRSISSCIVGIGLNINQREFVSDAPNPISLSLVTGAEYNLEESLSKLCLKLDARYNQLRNGEFRKINQDYLKILYRKDLWSTYSDEYGDFEGRLLGIDHTGQLMIETRWGKVKKYQFKEAVFR